MTAAWRNSAWILAGGSLILAISLGVRHGFGLFLPPMSAEFGWGREVFAFAIAVQNLIWGLVQPVTGALADRFGVARAVLIGGILYAVGLALMALSDSPMTLTLSAGLLIGLGLSGTSFSVILGAVGRAVPPEKRSMAMGIASAAGSFGQFIMLPGSLGLIEWLGWSSALLALGLLVALIVPLAGMMRSPAQAPVAAGTQQSLGEALREAAGHSGFRMLALGFFVCGFQVVFIGLHLPAYLVDRTLSFTTAAWALSLIGLFNVAGSLLAGVLGQHFRKKYLLSLIYAARAVVILAFVMLPLSAASAYVFAAVIGVLWLSTVPLTTGLVGQIFGVRYLGTIGGLVFLSHQLGSFAGVWLGGYLFDATGSYDLVWWLSIALGLLAAILHYPIDDRILVPRPAS